MKILVACEESQTVCKALRARGHEAYSADIKEPSGVHPEWHILGDVLPLINGDCTFATMDGRAHTISGKWDMLIAHPPCTYLTVTGNRWFNIAQYGDKAIQRHRDREAAIKFFMHIADADCQKSLLKILSELCPAYGENQTRSSSHGSLVMLLKKERASG